MPVYVYRNLETGETFEFTQRISEPALTVHPETGQPVKRMIQPVGIAFKGSGFYVNDNRSGGSSAGGSSKSSSSTSDGAGASGDSKPSADSGAASSTSASTTTSSATPPTKPSATPAT